MSGTFASAGYQGAVLWLLVFGFITLLAVSYRRDSNRAKRADRAAIEDHADADAETDG